MARQGEDAYGSFGSVPDAVRVDGSGAQPSGVRSSAEDFGAQVGAGIQKLGATGEEVANQFGGMILETAANQAELGYIKATGDLKAKYSQYEGLQAEAMRPQYEADLQAVHAQYRQNLPLGAQKAFDSNTIRSLGYQTSEYASYAAGQVKSANLKSHDALMDSAISRTGDLETVLNDQKFGEQVLAPIIHGGNAVADIHGDAILASGVNPDTGNYSYPDTPEGKAAEARHLVVTNAKLASAYETAAKTVADNMGASAAVDWAKKHWDMMPDAAKVKMNQYLAPKMKNEVIGGAVNDMNAVNDAAWTNHQNSSVPDSPDAGAQPDKSTPLSVRNNNPGNLRDSSTGEFRVFNTPEEGAAAMRSDLTAKITGNSPAMEKNFGKDYSATLSNLITTYAPAADKNDPKAYTDTISKETGIAPDQVLTTKDIDKLMPAMAKVEAGGSKGIPASGSAFPQYPNKADFLRSNMESSVGNAVDAYLKKYPDDYYGSQIVERRARSELTRQISNEDNKLRSDRDIVQNAIGGGMTKGQMPATYDELRAIPGIQPVLDRVHSEQGEFATSIDTRIAKANRLSVEGNSPNAFETINRVLQPQDEQHPNHIKNQSQLDALLGKDDTTGINMKDYNDAKPATELPDIIKEPLLKHMQEIAVANGNLDGKGQQRAVQWYNQQMTAYKQNQGLGEKKLDDATFASHIGEAQGPLYAPPTPSRMTQISNWVKETSKLGQVKVKNADGVMGYIPATNVEKALKAGYEKVE